MQTKLMTIFTRTPLHVGCGSSVGAVDQPVARERHTRFPVIPGSAIKGVLADLWNEERLDPKDAGGRKVVIVRSAEGVMLFGETDTNNPSAGKLLIGEGKLLAFPVRSAKGAFAWLTCPLVLNRFRRDAGASFSVPKFRDTTSAVVAQDSALCLKENNVIFEEYPLAAEKTLNAALADEFKNLSDDSVWQNEVAAHLAVVSDELFRHFAENACEIAQHNRIDDETGVVENGALFSQENVPSETLFYSVMNAQDADPLDKLATGLAKERNLVQIGADVTTGLGWCTVALKEVK